LNTKNTQQKILEAAVKLLGTEGLKNFTVRRVAELSGANAAAINYYFRSKENLINEALRHFSDMSRSLFAVLHDESLLPLERFKAFLIQFATHLTTYPGFMKSIVMQAMNNEELELRAKQSMIKGRETLLAILAEATQNNVKLSDGKQEILGMKLFQIMSCIIYPVVFGAHVKPIYNIDFDNPQEREKYISLLLHSFFPEITQQGGA